MGCSPRRLCGVACAWCWLLLKLPSFSQEAIQSAPQIVGGRSFGLQDVATLLRIERQIVGLAAVGSQVAQQLVLAANDHFFAANLAEDGALGQARRSREQPRRQVQAAHTHRRLDIQKAKQRRGHIQKPDGLSVRARWQLRGFCGVNDEQRDVYLLFVKAGAVVAASVLAELFAVIGSQHQQRTGASLAQKLD